MTGTADGYITHTRSVMSSESNGASARRQMSSENRRARCKSCFLTLLGFSVPLALMALLLLGALSKELLETALGPQGTEALSLYLVSA